MSASGIRCRFVYALDKFGLSETLVQQTTDFATAFDKSKRYLKKRLAMSGQNVEFVGMVLSLLGSPRVFQPFQASDLNLGVLAPGTIQVNAVPPDTQNYVADNDAEPGKGDVMFTCSTGAARHKKIFIAGLPDAVFQTNPDVPGQNCPGWQNLRDSYRNNLVADGWSYIGISDATGDFAKQDILSWGKDAGSGNCIAEVATNKSFARGQRVLINGVRRTDFGTPSINGLRIIDAVNLGGSSVFLTLRKTAVVDITKLADFTGTLRRYDTQAFFITSVDKGKITAHKRGNRFLLPPGRRISRGGIA